MTISHDWQSIALLVWRTPADAGRAYVQAVTAQSPQALIDRGWLGDVTRWWNNVRWQRWWVPRWARQHPLLAHVTRMPWDQRIAVAQLVYERVLGPVTNPRALFYAFVQCAPLLDPPISRQLLQPRMGAFACLHVRIQLAHGDRQSARTHLRQCDDCRRADMALQRVRQALLMALASVEYPALALPVSRRDRVVRHVAWMVAVALLWVIPVLMNRQAQPIALMAQAPDALLNTAQMTLFQPKPLDTDQTQYWQVEIYWRFANQSVTWLNAQAWYQLDPVQYRTQLVHQAGGNPYELDIVTPYQRLYHVTELYAPHRMLSVAEPATLLMPNNDAVADVWQWRMRQGAWGMAAQTLHDALTRNQIAIIGVSIGAYGEPLLRVSAQTSRGAVWFDVAPRTGELMAMWHIDAQNQPQLRWRLRQRAVVESDDRMRYVVIQPQLGAYEQRPTQALHPALPHISFDEGARDGNQVSLWQDNWWRTIDLESVWHEAATASP
ncbi:MAG: hypothetical protein FJ040_05470 [Chloroflexi bacterium]|nr:hypothetical protein [Chloroflexota bacterium]